MHRFQKHRIIRATQRGIAMLELSMALIVMAAIAAANMNAKALADRLQFAEMQGSSLGELSSAGETYLQEWFTELQNGMNIQKNSGNLTAGTSQGQTLAPTVSNFVDLGNLHKGFSPEATYVSSGGPGQYVFHIDRTGSNCISDPATCELDGYVYIDKPVTGPGGTDMDGPAIHAMLKKLGNKGCISLLPNPAVMVGLAGDCGMTNPVPGNPAGVVLVRFGFASSGLSVFVRNHDKRDIALLGNLAITKTATADSFMTNEKTVGASCPNNNALASGSGLWLVCVGNTWQAMGTLNADPGSACLPDGKVATSKVTGEQLICKNGVYIKSTSLMAKMVVVERRSVVDGEFVQKPTCDTGGMPNRSFSFTQSAVDITENPPKQAMVASTTDAGNVWQVRIKLRDETGNEASGNLYSLTQVMNIECVY